MHSSEPSFRRPSFVALDFEAANGHHASVCAIGVVRVTDGVLGDPRHWFVRPCPPYDFLGAINQELTGIEAKDLLRARGFDHWGPHLARNIGTSIVVGHNVKSADLSMFEQSWFGAGLNGPFPTYRYVDTQDVGRAVVPGLDRYRLDSLFEATFGHPMPGDHHRADDDAVASALLLLALLDRSGTNLEDWVRVRRGADHRDLHTPKRSGRIVELSIAERATNWDRAVG